jgi:hypothetical protein
MPSFFSKDAEEGWNRLVEEVAKRAQEHDSKVGVRYRYTDLLYAIIVVLLCVIAIGVIYWISRLFLGWL